MLALEPSGTSAGLAAIPPAPLACSVLVVVASVAVPVMDVVGVAVVGDGDMAVPLAVLVLVTGVLGVAGWLALVVAVRALARPSGDSL